MVSKDYDGEEYKKLVEGLPATGQTPCIDIMKSKKIEKILEHEGLSLIKKYDKYYIHFIGGQREEYPCDLAISNEEAMSVISSNENIKLIRDEYKNKVEWTSKYFIDSYLADYMSHECNMSKDRFQANIAKLNRHEDIKFELYETLIYEKFPITGAITVCGRTAESLKNTTHLSILGAYNFLIYMREDEKNALDDLKRGTSNKIISSFVKT